MTQYNDQAFVDSTMAYYVNQLDKFDETLNDPLYKTTWSRDIKLLPGVTLAVESTSFELTTYGYVGSQNATGKPWMSDNSTTLPNLNVNGQRVVTPVNPLGMELSYSIMQLEKSQKTGAPIDVKQTSGLKISYDMNTDEQVYVGDTFKQVEGLVNSTQIVTGNVVNGGGGSPLWSQKTSTEILDDVNTLLTSVWTNSVFAICPDKLLLPPDQFALINSQLLNDGTDSNVLRYLKRNSICMAENGRELEIVSCKFLKGVGVGATDRMVAYTNEMRFVRFPMVPIRRIREYYQGINFLAPYVWAYGSVEFVYPDTLEYADGI